MTVSVAREDNARKGVRRTLALFNWNVGLRTGYDGAAGATGFVFVGFALALGIPKERIGLLATAAGLACVGQLIGLLALNAARNKKRYTLLLNAADPLIFLATIIGALLAPPAWRFPLIVGGIFCCGLAINAANPMGSEWLASVIPPGLRGRYLGRRIQILSIVAIVMALTLGVVTKWLKVYGAVGYAGILGGAVLLGLLAVVPLLGAALPAASAEARVDWSTLPEVLQARPFWRYLAAMILYNGAFWLVGPYYQVYNLKVLALPEPLIAGLMVGYYLIKILLLPYVGRWVDRLGVQRALWLVAPLYVAFFVCYILSGPHAAWLVFVGWTLVGTGDAVFGVAGAVALYRVVPDTPARPAFFAVNSLLTMFSAAVSAALATWLVGALTHATLTLGPLRLGPFQIFFALGLLLYLLFVQGTRLMPEKGA